MWESNRSVGMENVGQSDVVNPWLVSGGNYLRNVKAIVARAIEPGMTDQEKATAIWWQEIQHRFHYPGENRELLSPVKVLNVYGHNTCGNDSICLAGLWKTAGLKVAPARLVGHCVTQVFYDGGWHLFDGDMHSLYLLRDNETMPASRTSCAASAKQSVVIAILPTALRSHRPRCVGPTHAAQVSNSLHYKTASCWDRLLKPTSPTRRERDGSETRATDWAGENLTGRV